MLKKLLKIKAAINPCVGKKFSSTVSRPKIGLIGAPFSKGQEKEGTHLCPQVFRKKNFVGTLKSLNYDIIDYGDLSLGEVDSKKKDESSETTFARSIGSAIKQLSENVSTCLKDDRVAVTVGGDNILSLGTIHGHHQHHSDVSVLWIDASADLHTHGGNLNEMSGTLLIKQLAELSKAKLSADIPGFEGLNPCIDASNIAYIGLRAVKPMEIDILEKLEIAHFSMRDIDKFGIFEVTSRALDKINPRMNKSIHVSFDIDSIDSYFAPSTSHPIPGGLTLREALSIGEQVSKTKLLRAFDLMEINPLIGSERDVENTFDVAFNIVMSFLGKQRIEHFTVTNEDD